VQSTGAYRDRTTLVVTTDHGRGRTPHDWTEHETGIAGAEDAWIAVIGPDTPDAGEAVDVPDAHLADVAATILQVLGLDWRELDPAAGAPIPGAAGP
jgi:arylsulfatase A-like enzyme